MHTQTGRGRSWGSTRHTQGRHTLLVYPPFASAFSYASPALLVIALGSQTPSASDIPIHSTWGRSTQSSGPRAKAPYVRKPSMTSCSSSLFHVSLTALLWLCPQSKLVADSSYSPAWRPWPSDSLELCHPESGQRVPWARLMPDT